MHTQEDHEWAQSCRTSEIGLVQRRGGGDAGMLSICAFQTSIACPICEIFQLVSTILQSPKLALNGIRRRILTRLSSFCFFARWFSLRSTWFWNSKWSCCVLCSSNSSMVRKMPEISSSMLVMEILYGRKAAVRVAGGSFPNSLPSPWSSDSLDSTSRRRWVLRLRGRHEFGIPQLQHQKHAMSNDLLWLMARGDMQSAASWTASLPFRSSALSVDMALLPFFSPTEEAGSGTSRTKLIKMDQQIKGPTMWWGGATFGAILQEFRSKYHDVHVCWACSPRNSTDLTKNFPP